MSRGRDMHVEDYTMIAGVIRHADMPEECREQLAKDMALAIRTTNPFFGLGHFVALATGDEEGMRACQQSR